jgi:hypothetical protein
MSDKKITYKVTIINSATSQSEILVASSSQEAEEKARQGWCWAIDEVNVDPQDIGEKARKKGQS